MRSQLLKDMRVLVSGILQRTLHMHHPHHGLHSRIHTPQPHHGLDSRIQTGTASASAAPVALETRLGLIGICQQGTHRINVHSCQGVDHCCTAQKEHGGHNNIGQQTEEQEGQVRCSAPARIDDLQDGVGCRRFALELNGQDTKEQDLDCGPRCIPGRVYEAVSIAQPSGLSS